MKTDKALRAAIARRKGELSYGFEFRIMRQIQREVERKENRRDLLGLVSVVLVSISFLTGIYVVFKSLLHIDMLQPFTSIRFPVWHPTIAMPSFEILNQCTLSLTILLAMLVLLSLDSLFRRTMRKRHSKNK